MQHPRVIGVLLATALVVAACGDDDSPEATPNTTIETAMTPAQGDAAAFPLTVDDCGREVTFDAPAKAVLTVGTAGASLVHAAGGADLIVARSGEFGVTPPGEVGEAIADAPVLVDEDPVQEVILGSGADLVIGYGLFETTPEDLEAAGVRHVTASGHCGDDSGDVLDLVVDDVRTLGRILDTSAVAETNADALEEALAQIEPLTDGGTIAALYWFGDDPSAFFGRSVPQAMFDRLGVENIFGDVPETFGDVNLEALLDADPDTILLIHDTTPDIDFAESQRRLEALPGAADLTAVQEGRVVGLSYLFTEPDPGAIEGLRNLAAALAAL